MIQMSLSRFLAIQSFEIHRFFWILVPYTRQIRGKKYQRICSKNFYCSREHFLSLLSRFLFHKHFLLLLSRFLFTNVFCYFCNVFYSCFHHANNNNNKNNNNKASFRTFERCSRSKTEKIDFE